VNLLCNRRLTGVTLDVVETNDSTCCDIVGAFADELKDNQFWIDEANEGFFPVVSAQEGTEIWTSVCATNPRS
jgi:hypothetical protein